MQKNHNDSLKSHILRSREKKDYQVLSLSEIYCSAMQDTEEIFLLSVKALKLELNLKHVRNTTEINKKSMFKYLKVSNY